MKRFLSALIIGAALTGSTARAVIVISTPMTYATARVVGTAEGHSGDNPGNDSAGLAQNILNYITTTSGVGNTYTDVGDGNRFYQGSSLVDYSGTITGLGTHTTTGSPSIPNGVTIPGGWEYVIAKYDGQNAGWVLFYLGGYSTTIPTLSQTFWGDTGSDQYKISGYTVFNSVPNPEDITTVPEPATIVAAALVLLPLGASTVRILRKNRTV